MGLSQSIPVVTSEVAVTGAIVLVGVYVLRASSGAAGSKSSRGTPASQGTSLVKKKGSKKGKKGKKDDAGMTSPSPAVLVLGTETFAEDPNKADAGLPKNDSTSMSQSQIDDDATPPPPSESKRAKKNKKGKQAAANTPPSISTSFAPPKLQKTSSTSGPATASSSFVDDDGWMKVHAGVDRAHEPKASSSADERQTLAERLLPKPTPTVVDDMLEERSGGIARVIRVRADQKPPTGFSWKDYDNVELEESGTTSVNDEDDESGWDVVKSKRKKRTDTPKSTPPPPPTKKQLQNAARREAEKVARAEGERQRLEILAQHKKQLEQARMDEHSSSKGPGRKGKVLSGGMNASVDDNGALVWE